MNDTFPRIGGTTNDMAATSSPWPPPDEDEEDGEDTGEPLWSMDTRDEVRLHKPQNGELWIQLQAAQRESREEVERRG